MKKTLIALLVLGVSGPALMAESTIDLSGLPAEVRADVERAKETAAGQANPIQSFVTEQEKNTQELQNQYNEILKSQGYLVHNPEANAIMQVIIQYLKENRNDIENVKGTEVDAQTVLTDLTIIPPLLSALKKIPPSASFPDKCAQFSGTQVVGIVQKKVGTRSDYEFLAFEGTETKQYSFIQPIEDVGLYGSGKEYVVSPTPNDKIQSGWLTEKNQVACLSNPYTPSKPLNPTEEKK